MSDDLCNPNSRRDMALASQNGRQMSDDLRDRIINAIWDDLIVQRDSDIPLPHL